MPNIVEEKGFSQKEANQTVPFPVNEVMQEGQIEEYLLSLRNAFPSFEELPDTVTAPGLDAYGSWFASLTKLDPARRERGAFIHIDVVNNNLIYPTNPHVGTKNESTAEYGHGRRFFPLVRTHSHPDNTSFSPHDLKRAIGSTWFIAELLATQEANYLLLRTYETETEDIDKSIERMDEVTEEIHKGQLDMLSVLDPAVKSGEIPSNVADYMKRRHLQEDIKEFGSDSLAYLFTLATTIQAAERFKLGFYRSDLKGNFTRIDERILEDIKIRQRAVIDRLE